jgi:hypothetical protein
VPQGQNWLNAYWDVPKRYRKHYFKALINQSLKPGKSYTFKAITIPFNCDRSNWLSQARKLLDTIK